MLCAYGSLVLRARLHVEQPAPRLWPRNGGENASHDDGEADPAEPPRLNRIQRNEQTAQIAEQSAPELLQKVM